MIFIIKLGNKLIVRILNKTAILAFCEQLAKCFQFGHVILKQPKASSNNFAGRAVSAASELSGDKLIKMSPKSHAGVFTHILVLYEVPNIGILWYITSNKANQH